VQAKLLRVFEQREVTRVGSLKPTAIDVRFVAATNRDLEMEIARGTFRQDLYFRLSGVILVLPPLRERVGEIEQLAVGIVAQACAQARRPRPPRISSEAMALMKRYAWPGNIRELRNVLERAVLLCSDDAITLAHLPVDRMGRVLPQAVRPRPPTLRPSQLPPSTSGLHDTGPWPSTPSMPFAAAAVDAAFRDEAGAEEGRLTRGFDGSDEERRKIEQALARCGGNQSLAARLLGVSRRTLVTRIAQYGLPRPRKLGRQDD
jgi:DNA-binding NtrC family response regulator